MQLVYVEWRHSLNMNLSSSSSSTFSEVKIFVIMKYRKIPIISPGLIFVQKAFLVGLFLGGACFQRGLFLERILRFKMGWA